MFGLWIKVDLGEGFNVKVWVNCTPNTPLEELEKRAKQLLRDRLNEIAEFSA